jgi:hypothetical protein
MHAGVSPAGRWAGSSPHCAVDASGPAFSASRPRLRHRARPSLAVSAPSTSRPPPSTAGVGASAVPSQVQATPKTISSCPSSEASGALSTRPAATAITQGMASWTTPSRLSSCMSWAEACSGQASGSETAADSTAPISTAADRSCWRAAVRRAFTCISTHTRALHSGTSRARPVPSRWRRSPPATWEACIQAMPPLAMAMATQVRSGSCCLSTKRAISAVSRATAPR